MSRPCTVLIAAQEALPALAARCAHFEGDQLTFTDREALRALETITARKPAVVVLERLFAATSRGAALINRIKADPSLPDTEIRVAAHDSDYIRVSPRRVAPAAAPVDQRGTRRAPRFRMGASADTTIDGNQASLVDLSTIGAQVVAGGVLKPNQRVKVALADDHGQVRFDADVAWASFEVSPKGARYRAGLAFIDPDAGAVDAFCSRHKT